MKFIEIVNEYRQSSWIFFVHVIYLAGTLPSERYPNYNCLRQRVSVVQNGELKRLYSTILSCYTTVVAFTVFNIRSALKF